LATLGKITDGGSNSSSTTDKTIVSQFTASANAVVIAGHSRLWVTAGTANIEMVVYSDSAGLPGSLIAQSNTVTISNTTEAQVDFTFSGVNQVATTNGTPYWIGFSWADPGTNSVTWSRDATAAQAQQNNLHLASSFGTPGTALSGPVDTFVDLATVITGAAETGTLSETSAVTKSFAVSDSAAMSSTSAVTVLTPLGKTSDGATTVSSSADKTVASKATASSDGILVAGHARVSVTGGSATTKLVVYTDAPGSPSTKVAESDPVVVTNTTEAIKDYAFTGSNQAFVTNGVDYWLSLAWLDPGTDSVVLSKDNTAGQRSEVSAYAPDPFGTASTATGPVDVWVETIPGSPPVAKSGTDTATLSEVSSVSGSANQTVSDGGALDELAEVSSIVNKTATDTGTLTEATSVVTPVTLVGPGTDTGTLTEAAAQVDKTDIITAYDGVGGGYGTIGYGDGAYATGGAMSEGATSLAVTNEVVDTGVLTDRMTNLDRPPESGEQFTLSEASQVVDLGGGLDYFGPDRYFGPNEYFGSAGVIALPPGTDPTGGVDPDRDDGDAAADAEVEPPPDYAVLVAITTTGEVIDELAWEKWTYTDTVDWARPGSMTVTVPLLGKDRLGEYIRQSLKNVNSAGPTVSLVLTRKGRALWAGPVASMGWSDDAVDIQCMSIAKLMDSRVVLNPDYLLDPGNVAGNLSFTLSPRDLVIKLLELGTTGDRRELPMTLPTITGASGAAVQYLASDLGSVYERVTEQVQRDGGPDVVIHPVLSLDQATLVWQVQVEERVGSTVSTATWDYPVSIKSLTGDTDSSQMVTTGFVLGDTQTSVGSIRGFGVQSIDKGVLPPAMERADRTSVSNKSQAELDALAVSYVAANSAPAETWQIAVHADADPVIGEQWTLGDHVVISVTDHPWLDDGEYQRRIVGITHDPDTIQLETVEVN
jgi:hypothetical protein